MNANGKASNARPDSLDGLGTGSSPSLGMTGGGGSSGTTGGAPGTTQVAVFSEFTFESGQTVRSAPVAYQTWGSLNEAGDNAVLVCHTLTGDTNVAEWWGELLGPGRALDTDSHLIVCANSIGSPYGTLSPLTANPDTGRSYAADFPAASIRDTVRLHRMLLDELGVTEVKFVVGGSMGGMLALEWLFDPRVRAAVAVGVGASHSAWCIGWSETQRQAIYADPNWRHGHYDTENPPQSGLAAARMIAMMTYRSFQSFGDRFGRAPGEGSYGALFSAESYLRHQGSKLVDRFDANCYVHLTRQMDTHDVGRGRQSAARALGGVEKPVLVVGIDSDVLYPLSEQQELTRLLPAGELAVLASIHGHDGFLIETDTLNDIVVDWYLRNNYIINHKTDAVHEAA